MLGGGGGGLGLMLLNLVNCCCNITHVQLLGDIVIHQTTLIDSILVNATLMMEAPTNLGNVSPFIQTLHASPVWMRHIEPQRRLRRSAGSS